MKKLLLLPIILLLTGCTSPEQLAEQRRRQAEDDAAVCRSYGLRPGSEAFGNCRLQLDLARQQRYDHYDRPRIGTGIYYGHWH